MTLPRIRGSRGVLVAVISVTLLIVVAVTAGCSTSEPVVTGSEPTATTEPTTTPSSVPFADITITLDSVATGFDQPLFVTGANDGSGRLFVVEKTGRIWIVRDGEKSSAAWLDISDLVSTNSERGLLGLAFAPDFAQTGEFYIDYTDVNGNTVVARLTAADPASDTPVDPGTEQKILTQDQPYSNHNGGMVVFGPDGYLYVGLGDGGSGGDPHGNGQNLGTLLGKILRIDVTGQATYAIPADNPFASGTEGRPEIWVYGVRNPWRFSFDRDTGDLWIGDVGQDKWEEIDFIGRSQASSAPENLGWNYFEGMHLFEGTPPPEVGFTMPLVEYDHAAGESVTGGYVYRGSDYPDLNGVYLYGDYVNGKIWGIRNSGGSLENRELSDTDMLVVTFGEDDAGELYVVDFNGGLYRVTTP